MQPALLEKHASTLSWLSTTMHWKSEFAFFQKLLDDLRGSISSTETLSILETFENQITYFMLEAIEDLRKKLRNHENRLAKMLQTHSEWDIQYYNEHDTLMKDAQTLSESINSITGSIRQWTTQYMYLQKLLKQTPIKPSRS
jgi:DNA repair exonuclease SbcCD ATPase subunit